MKVGRIEKVEKDGSIRSVHGEPGAEVGAVVQCFADIAPQPLRWLWPGRIPLGKITLLIGDPGLGKSLVTVDLAARLSRGTGFADGTDCEQSETVFLSAEDDAADTIRPRLDAAGAELSRIHLLEAVRVPRSGGGMTEKSFSLETDITYLERTLAERPGVRLVVIDPISAYMGEIDSNSNAEIRGLLTPFTAMAARCGVAVLAVTHLRKSPGAVVHRAIGSIAFAAAARAVWAVTPDPEDAERRLMLGVKQNLSAAAAGMAFRLVAPNGTAQIAWEPGAITINVNDVLGDNSGSNGSMLAEARQWLMDALADAQVTTSEIRRQAKVAGIAWMTLRRAADSLGVIRKKSAFSGGWEWALPEDAQRCVAKMSTFEQASENTSVTERQRIEGAHQSHMSAFVDDDDEVRV